MSPRPLAALGACLLLLSAGCAGVPAPDGGGEIRFEEVSRQEGFVYRAAQTQAVTTGGGVYVSDVNGDGWPDLLALGGTARETERGWRGKGPALFVNTGDGFEWSRQLQPRLDEKNYVAAHFVDYDTDGDDDLLLLARMAEPTFLENEDGEFVRRDPASVGLDREFTVPLGATSGDYDGDGRPDLFVYQNGNWQNTTPDGYENPNEPIPEDNGAPNVLFHNTGDGFERVTDAGIAGERWTLAASFVDVTGDGSPDIHVANDYNTDIVYVNRGNGSFERRELSPNTDRNAMSSEVMDVNADGRPDIFVTNIYFPNRGVEDKLTSDYIESIFGERASGNNLLVNRGNGSFVDRADEYGVRRGGWGWAATAVDFDHDGDRDLLQTTKQFDDTFFRRMFGDDPAPAMYRYPVLYEREGDAFTKRNASRAGLLPTNGRGVATLDYDRDGDLDVVVGLWSGGTYKLYENTGARGHWFQVRVEGGPNQTALGAEVTVETGDGKRHVRRYISRADYESQDTRVVHFGLGDVGEIETVRVVYPDGTEHAVTDVGVDQRLVVRYNGTVDASGSESGSRLWERRPGGEP